MSKKVLIPVTIKVSEEQLGILYKTLELSREREKNAIRFIQKRAMPDCISDAVQLSLAATGKNSSSPPIASASRVPSNGLSFEAATGVTLLLDCASLKCEQTHSTASMHIVKEEKGKRTPPTTRLRGTTPPRTRTPKNALTHYQSDEPRGTNPERWQEA